MRTTSPSPMRPTRSLSMKLTALVMIGATLTAFAPEARADDVSPTGKGIVGGALLGGEVVTITEAIIGVRAGWAYAIGFGVGAIGGGIGGYFVEKGSSDGRAPVYMLAGGLALLIPSIVLTLNATRYMPSEDATEDKPPPNAPAANPGAPSGSVVAPTGNAATPSPTPTPPPAAPPPAGGGGTTPPPPSMGPQALLGVTPTMVRLSLPVPELHPMYSLRERRQYGLPDQHEVRLPILAVTF
jgi:hypothetical protein